MPLEKSNPAIVNKKIFESKCLQNNSILLSDKKEVNRFGQPIDLRNKNSWNSALNEIDVLELIEVNLINQISPFILIKKLTPLFKKSKFENKFVINVTSSEGQFSYKNKTKYHPHTNMTKASLNMLTRTIANEYAADNIYVNSVRCRLDIYWSNRVLKKEAI